MKKNFNESTNTYHPSVKVILTCLKFSENLEKNTKINFYWLSAFHVVRFFPRDRNEK